MSMKRRPPLERLIEKIDQRGPDACWLWTASVGTWGYGSFTLDGKTINASRAAYLLLKGAIPDGHVVCHKCDNPLCCNPAHLWLGSQADNLRDCREMARAKGQFQTGHAPYGRKISPEQLENARLSHYHGGVPQTHIAKVLGVHSATLSRALRGTSR